MESMPMFIDAMPASIIPFPGRLFIGAEPVSCTLAVVGQPQTCWRRSVL